MAFPRLARGFALGLLRAWLFSLSVPVAHWPPVPSATARVGGANPRAPPTRSSCCAAVAELVP